MTEPSIAWEDVLEVGAGGPGCGRLLINGRQPKGGYRYLPPAICHAGQVYASTFVPGGFIVCAIDPETLSRTEMTARLPYVRLHAVDETCLVYFDRHDADTLDRVPLRRKQGALGRLFGRRSPG